MKSGGCLCLALILCASNLAAQPCEPIITFAENKLPSREIFISPVGSNTNGDGSRTRPFQSLNRALEMVQPGDAIRLLPGEYRGGISINNIQGTAQAPIWIGGESSTERPVINEGGSGLHISRARYLILENLEVAKATGNGINCDDGGDLANKNATSHLIFRNLVIRDVGNGRNQDGLKLSGVNHFFVLDCHFVRISAGGSGIDHVGCHHGLIANSTFQEMGNSVQCKGGSEDIEIRANKFFNGGGRTINIGGSTGFQFFRPALSKSEPNCEARNIRVFANLIEGSDAPVAFVGAVDSIVANNTIIRPTHWVVRILQETVSKDGFTFLPSGRNQFINNLIYYSRGRVNIPVSIGSNTDALSFAFANNLWFAFDRPGQSKPQFPGAEANGIYGNDPLFRDGERDYSLLPASPAISRGRAVEGLKDDLTHNCFMKPPSIGALEGASSRLEN